MGLAAGRWPPTLACMLAPDTLARLKQQEPPTLPLACRLHCACCRVTAHYVAVKEQARPKTVILMKFSAAVMQREQRMPGG